MIHIPREKTKKSINLRNNPNTWPPTKQKMIYGWCAACNTVLFFGSKCTYIKFFPGFTFFWYRSLISSHLPLVNLSFYGFLGIYPGVVLKNEIIILLTVEKSQSFQKFFDELKESDKTEIHVRKKGNSSARFVHLIIKVIIRICFCEKFGHLSSKTFTELR